MMQAQALLFDMDGTLIDSGEAIQIAWRNWAAKYGLDADEVYDFSHGRKAVATIEHFGPADIDHQGDADVFHGDIAANLDKISAIPGAKKLLTSLRDGEWAVVTSATQDLAKVSLIAAGLPLPKLIVGAGQVSRSKPDPEGYVLAARELGVEPSQVIVFEDAEAGLQAGRAAGAKLIGVGHFQHLKPLADNWVTDLRGIEINRDNGLDLRLPRA